MQTISYHVGIPGLIFGVIVMFLGACFGSILVAAGGVVMAVLCLATVRCFEPAGKTFCPHCSHRAKDKYKVWAAGGFVNIHPECQQRARLVRHLEAEGFTLEGGG